jgi:glycosyltransferase involved in cell wall biosynthesis
MRILQVVTDDDRRGAQIFALDLEAAMRDLGEQVETIALTSVGGSLEVEALGPTRRSVPTVRRLRERAVRSDVVVAHGSTTLPMSVLATAGTSTPVVYRQISDPRFWAATWNRRLRVAGLLRRCRRVVALSPTARRAVADHYRIDVDDISVIPNGVPAGRFPRPDTQLRERRRRKLGVGDDFVVTFLGALVPEKGADVVVRAAAGLEGTRVLVAGEGPERSRLESLVARSGAPVDLLGQVDHPVELLQASDVVVLPSRGGDSMPATIIEANLVGIPVVATPVGSIGDMVSDGLTGVLLPVPDPEVLRRELVGLRDDPDLRRSLGDRASAIARERYEIVPVARMWRDVIRSVAP